MRPLTILLIEDEPVVALDMQLELEQAGYRVATATDADTALRVCAEHLPDLVILNFVYANSVDGMSLARILQTQYLAPVLFITGASWEYMEESAYFYAGHSVLYKPFTKLQFRAAMKSVLEKVCKQL